MNITELIQNVPVQYQADQPVFTLARSDDALLICFNDVQETVVLAEKPDPREIFERDWQIISMSDLTPEQQNDVLEQLDKPRNYERRFIETVYLLNNRAGYYGQAQFGYSKTANAYLCCKQTTAAVVNSDCSCNCAPSLLSLEAEDWIQVDLEDLPENIADKLIFALAKNDPAYSVLPGIALMRAIAKETEQLRRLVDGDEEDETP